MAAEPNATGMARLLYLAGGTAIASWGIWGADPGWTRWAWLVLGGALIVLALIGYSPWHAWFAKRNQKAA